MASRIQCKETTVATTGLACLVATVTTILITSVYISNSAGWPQFVQSVFAAATVCAVGASALAYAAHQQYVVKRSLFSDQGANEDFDYRSTGRWAVVTGATDGIGKEYARQLATRFKMDICLVGRNSQKLRAVADLLRKETSERRLRIITVVADLAKDPIAREGKCYAGYITEGTQNYDHVKYDTASDQGHKQIAMAFLEKLSADLDTECMYLNRKSDTVDTYGIRVQYVKPAYVATAMLQSTNPDIKVISQNGDDSDDEYDVENYGDRSWWDVKRRMIANRLERWLVPTPRRWVQSALRKGGQLYAGGSNRPAKFTGYDPHTLLIWVTTMASILTPRWWYLDNVLISGMLKYRTKGRIALAEKNKRINESN